MTSLYQLTGRFLELKNQLEFADEQTAADTIDGDGVMDGIAEKAQGYVMIVRQFEASASAKRDEADRLIEGARADEAKADALKSALMRAMQAINADKIKTNLFTLSVTKNPPAVEITEQSLIPSDFYVNKPQLDKQKIKDALKSGLPVAGATLVQRVSLRIK